MSSPERPEFIDPQEPEEDSYKVNIKFSSPQFDGADEILQQLAAPLVQAVNSKVYMEAQRAKEGVDEPGRDELIAARRAGEIPHERIESRFNPTDIELTPIIGEQGLKLIVRSWHETAGEDGYDMPISTVEDERVPTTRGVIQHRTDTFDVISNRQTRGVYLQPLEVGFDIYYPLAPLDAIYLHRMSALASEFVQPMFTDSGEPEELV